MRRQAYDIFVRGSLGPEPAIGRSLFRRVPTDELDAAVEGLIAGWLDRREPDESFLSLHPPGERRRPRAAGRPRAGQDEAAGGGGVTVQPKGGR